MASVYVYRDILHLNIRTNGKQIRKSTGLKNTKENMMKVHQEIMPLFLANIDGPSVNVKLRYYANKFLEEKKYITKERTYYRYKNIIDKWILPRYGQLRVINIKSTLVKDFVNHQFELGKTAKSIEQYITVFSGILQEAVYDNIIVLNPFKHIKRRKKEKPIVTPFSKEEVKLLLENTNGWFHNYIGIASHLGLRSGEMIGLKWCDVTNTHIQIRRTRDNNVDTPPKTQSSMRDLPIFDSVRPFIELQRSITGDKEYLFYSYRNLPYANTGALNQHHWYPLLDKLGLKRRRIYELRHTFATNMLNSGYFKVTEIAHLMGHTTTEYLFNVYSRYIQSEKNNLPLDKSIY